MSRASATAFFIDPGAAREGPASSVHLLYREYEEGERRVHTTHELFGHPEAGLPGLVTHACGAWFDTQES